MNSIEIYDIIIEIISHEGYIKNVRCKLNNNDRKTHEGVGMKPVLWVFFVNF